MMAIWNWTSFDFGSSFCWAAAKDEAIKNAATPSARIDLLFMDLIVFGKFLSLRLSAFA